MKSIFLVNAFSGRGHLDSYARLYSRALLELGYRVTLLAETDGGTADYLSRNAPELTQSFSFASFEALRRFDGAPCPSRGDLNLVQRTRLIWNEEGPSGIISGVARISIRQMSALVPHGFRLQVARAQRAIARGLLATRLAKRLGLPSYFDIGRIPFQHFVHYVEKAAAFPPASAPDLVFFLYLDLMAEQERKISALDGPGGAPWAGILFHPRRHRSDSADAEGYFRSGNARGGIFLVPAISAYAEALPHLKFAMAPDVADLELPQAPSELAAEIRRRANGRTLVLQIGSITAHKGISTLVDVIRAADPDRFFFAIIGEVYWGTFGPDKGAIHAFLGSPPENVFFSSGYIPDERSYNSLIAASDIVYAVYKDFSSSSNSLTKASGFGRPILVAEDSLMGERVRAFRIGAAAPEGDARAVLAELTDLAQRAGSDFAFASYQKSYSLEELKSVLAAAVPAWLERRPAAVTTTPAGGVQRHPAQPVDRRTRNLGLQQPAEFNKENG
ncbi:hypothetical protein MTR72_39070 [Bradyrhizobium sp. ISRA442]|uniref:hypothetical protein n=1 Tax=Bradyrhizobium sp. ISRA442 TaxID=2866197 RepID=UPI00311AEF17